MQILSRRRLTPDLAELLPRKARTFALAARFLPAPQRDATVTLYAFCRQMDDLVDEPATGMDERAVRARLCAWRRWLQGRWIIEPSPEPLALGDALRDVLITCQVPTEYLIQLIDGVESDLDPVQMPTFVDLRRYSFLVAGTVGLAMCHVLGSPRPAALAAAAELGIAMQLTNILRDVGADLRDGRCYLPRDEIVRFGYPPDQFQALGYHGAPDERFRALLRFQIERARGYYARGLAGIWLLPPEARPAMLIAGRLYRAILAVIESSGYDVLHRRAVVSRRVKVYESLAALLLVRLWGDNAVPDGLGSPTERLAELSAPGERLAGIAL